jgi:Dyp-type peroxidase family
MPELELDDIQGLILRGYRQPLLRLFVLEVLDAARARRTLGSLAGGVEQAGDAAGVPELRITSAREWPGSRPDYCLNLGLTWPGLLALGLGSLPELSFQSFPSFLAGARARASELGDTGDSAPEHWTCALGTGRDHALIALYAADSAALRASTERLAALLGDAWRVHGQMDGAALPSGRVHFGYHDGISQPNIIGGPERALADGQPPVPPWQFVLKDDPEANYHLPQPALLGNNGSFGVLRVLRQDVVGFEQFLHSEPGIDPELLAAKLCGRWRSGAPLALAPDAASAPVPWESRNDFDYTGDAAGRRCPIGAHIRRTFPRSMPVQGGGNHLHRLVRRGMPYGPEYTPGQAQQGQAQDDVERGLLGFFINASIENQYEFVMKNWCNTSDFTPGLPLTSKDALVGDSSAEDSRFDFPVVAGPARSVRGFARFVQTRGGAYCLLPSLTALRFIAQLG